MDCQPHLCLFYLSREWVSTFFISLSFIFPPLFSILWDMKIFCSHLVKQTHACAHTHIRQKQTCTHNTCTHATHTHAYTNVHTHVYMHMIPYCMPLSTLCFGLNYPIFYTCYHYMWLIILYRRQYNRGQETLLFAVSIFLLSLSSVAKYMTMFSSTIVKIITYFFEAFVLL